MAYILTTELTFGPFSYGTATETNTGIKQKFIWIVDETGVVVNNPFADPVLTIVDFSVNPPTWSFVMPDLQVGDRIQLDFTSNGSTPDGTAEETHDPVTSDEAINGDISWSTFTGFAGSATVKWRQRYGRTISGTPIWSNWSNILSVVVPAVAFTPAVLFGVGDIGYAWDTTDLTHIWQSNAGATGGAFTSPVGRLDDKSGLGNNWNSEFNDTTRPTLANTNNGLMTFTAGSNTRLKNIGGFYAKTKMTWIGVIKGAASANFIWAETSSSSSAPVYAPGLRGNNATQMLNEQRNDASTQLATAMACALLDGAVHVYMIEDTGTVLTLWLDGVQTASAAYSRNGATTTNQSWLGVADVAGVMFGPMTVSIGSGITISRQLTGTLGTAGTEKTLAYNWVAALHGLTQL